ncbi:hypothetical protein ACHAWF_001598 [Thalassiosira exigua]
MTATKQTRFGTVEIRRYPIVLSDNPGGKHGPPIELGWDYTEDGNEMSNDRRETAGGTMSVSFYEKGRQGRRRSRLYLSHLQREEMLLQAEYTQRELDRATRRATTVRRKRCLSYMLSNPAQKVESNVRGDVAARKLRRAKENLRDLRDDDGHFHDHSDIYDCWWLPSIIWKFRRSRHRHSQNALRRRSP